MCVFYFTGRNFVAPITEIICYFLLYVSYDLPCQKSYSNVMHQL